MTLADELARDYEVFDGGTTVWFSAAGAAPVEVSGVLSGPLQQWQLESLGDAFGLDSSSRTFSLPAEQLGTIEPANGDTIRDGQGTVWRIVSGSRLTLGSRWLVICRKDH
jgi:hypothetical protein